MAIKLKYPWLGVAIPSFIISFIGYNSHYFILSNFLSIKKQIWFQFSLSMIWVSYLLAIFTNPGKPPKNCKPIDFNDQRKWNTHCKKCNNYKPERSHHCKTCNQCVLMMDHHCPWTMNCVGYKNFPHFIRFLMWIIITTGFLLVHLLKRTMTMWNLRHLPSYIFDRNEIIFLTILIPMDAFILLTISLLFIRCFNNQIVRGMTQIEFWELERLENLFYNKKLLPMIIATLWEVYPNERTKVADNYADDLLSRRKKVRFENIVNFPYDIDIWTNMNTVMGSAFNWIWIFGVPDRNGLKFEKNEISLYEPGSSVEDLLLSLPWPPDKGRNFISNKDTSVESLVYDGEQVVRNRASNDTNISTINKDISREEWNNDWGESLVDFGVDIEAEVE
ncbi:palmitoyltransferase PFA4 NDAI_0C02650 [Naumovozyma dairenensis CBS 421]|uniref:Palmitoyltransferase PFA4 n=1 Tax=Naumovozyma dairenensis (strain ATCC 10597 / BCRC 20456 / CBS 421 / NBRC 0211 / NRRL Y-12639) TaxID=1071378 RepID=G0W814_NAUDC|nr:hypothetical protein NDAI_0C02650 [Naumovozyma dairenensis CBS 421]CCD23925.1 hypothetical protein NDAI_0C02650 [Naumovozyma dairenensis CBS 421]